MPPSKRFSKSAADPRPSSIFKRCLYSYIFLYIYLLCLYYIASEKNILFTYVLQQSRMQLTFFKKKFLPRTKTGRAQQKSERPRAFYLALNVYSLLIKLSSLMFKKLIVPLIRTNRFPR